MPIFTLHTNVKSGKIAADFASNLVDLVAKTLGKPKSYVVVNIIADQNMNWALIDLKGGDASKPCGTATLSSIGQLGRDANKRHSKALFPFIEKSLGIPGDRLYITYVDLNKADVGYTATTFDDLL